MKKTKNWIASLNKALAECGVDKISVDSPSEEWFRLQDLIKETGRGETGARKMIDKLLKQGKLEKKLFKIRSSQEEKIYPTPHYRFVDK